MTEPRLKTLSDATEQAHARVQERHEHINPVVEMRQRMRNAGIPADVMTIDCLRTRNRILMVLHDEQPDVLLYQFTTVEREMEEQWLQIAFAEVTVDLLVQWMEERFSGS